MWREYEYRLLVALVRYCDLEDGKYCKIDGMEYDENGMIKMESLLGGAGGGAGADAGLMV